MLLLRVRDQRLIELFIGRTTAALVVGAKGMEPVQRIASEKREGTWGNARSACTHHRKLSADSRVVTECAHDFFGSLLNSDAVVVGSSSPHHRAFSVRVYCFRIGACMHVYEYMYVTSRVI